MTAPNRWTPAAILTLSALLTGLTSAQAVEPMSWPHHHGPQFNRISRERDLTLDWDSDDPQASSQKQELWQIEGLSAAADPLVFNDKLYVLHWGSSGQELPAQDEGADPQRERPGQSPVQILTSVSAWHIQGRDTVARFRFDLPSLELNDSAPLPTFAGDPIWRQLYCLGMGHEIIAIDADYGYEMWQRPSLPPTFQNTRVISTVPPLVYEHLLIITQLLQTEASERLVLINAYDRRNGLPVWQHEQQVEADFELTSLVPSVLANQVVLTVPDKRGTLELMQIQTGRSLLTLPTDEENARASDRVLTEILFQNGQLMALSFEKNGDTSDQAQRNWRIDLWTLPNGVGGTDPKKVASWTPKQAHHMTSLLHDGILYTASSANRLQVYSSVSGKQLHDLELGEGLHREYSPQRLETSDDNGELEEERSKLPRYHLVWVANQLLATSTHGYWQTFDCAHSACQIIYTAERNEPLVGIPAISKKRLYVRTSQHLIAMGPIDNGDAISHPLIPLSEVANDAQSVTPGAIQLVPAFATLEPGWQQNFRVMQYNEHGHFLEELDPTRVEWTWTGPGMLDSAAATLEIPTDSSANDAFELTVKVGNQTASSAVSLRPAAANVQALSPGE
ncbi:outer membrane protein assembly factor BamB family protein [Rubinisphaera margarita]|uniref:outer membrane protein assembly factor BamB family protein n=1 Tax=Rubinisphaera margarita TaxID=2909586 RepID=UPI001EE8974B|nr:PQQ-binding-like beta-propeller repeat protein [Rubinisphaera margarita]MCG6155337.1 PQQ-like beta-propeller repeat protein [Rubinisphaera margarita]